MNRKQFLSLAASSALGLAITLPAAARPKDAAGVPTVEAQLKLFTDRLDLSSSQQARVTTILRDLHDATVKLMQDESISQSERMENIHAWRLKTDKRMREILSDEQKKKLDQVEQEPHPELHGDIN